MESKRQADLQTLKAIKPMLSAAVFFAVASGRSLPSSRLAPVGASQSNRINEARLTSFFQMWIRPTMKKGWPPRLAPPVRRRYGSLAP